MGQEEAVNIDLAEGRILVVFVHRLAEAVADRNSLAEAVADRTTPAEEAAVRTRLAEEAVVGHTRVAEEEGHPANSCCRVADRRETEPAKAPQHLQQTTYPWSCWKRNGMVVVEAVRWA